MGIMKNEVEKEPLKKVKKSDVAQKLEIPEEDLGMGSERLIQCLEIKMETNDSSDNAGCALDLQPEELIQCLPCAGQSLSAFNDSLVLPYVRKDHDLIEHLAMIVIKDVSNHPKKPA